MEVEWICENHIITNEMIKKVENVLNITFPEDFLSVIKKYDAGSPFPNEIYVEGKGEIVSNLVSFLEDDISYILHIIETTEFFKSTGLIPIAEDPFGNLFCYSFDNEGSKIVFWDHETYDQKQFEFVCNNFSEFIKMLQ